MAGEVRTNPGLAATFRSLATKGIDGFYNGPIAHAIVEAVQSRGGFLSLADLAYHAEKGSTTPDPIFIRFNDTVDVWEHPTNGQGIVALMALGSIRGTRTNQEDPSVLELKTQFSRVHPRSDRSIPHRLLRCMLVGYGPRKIRLDSSPQSPE